MAAPLKFGAKNDRVARLQHAVLTLGYLLPRWGIDRQLGAETWNALRSYCYDRGKPLPDGASGLSLPQGLEEEVLAAAESFGPPKRPSRFLDVTGLHPGTLRRGPRPWTQIKAIVLHQTAILLGPKPERWYTLAAHIGIPQDGRVILVNPPTQVIWHANSFNKSSVGIEISGNFEGVEGDPTTLWQPGGGPHRMNDAQMESARATVKWLVETIAANGGNIRFIYAHRQASTDRRGDPGSRVWQRVGLWAQETLGLSDGGDDFAQGGYAIPKARDPGRKARY
jgi:hypothetical protein